MVESSLLTILAERIWANAQFQAQLSKLRFSNVYHQILGHMPPDQLDEISLVQLLQAAATLSASKDIDQRKAAYMIAISTFNLYREQFPNIRNVLHVIFGNLGNFPAIDFMFSLSHLDKSYDIPSSPLYELIQHEKANTVLIGKEEVLLTEFQHQLWSGLSEHKNFSVSASTSAGKSYALQTYLINEIALNRATYVLYLVPTRALIGQVSESLGRWFSKLSLDFQVSTIPASPAELSMNKGIYVLTQERAHVLLSEVPDIKFDIVVVDEAQTIADGARGILLQVVLEKLFSENVNTRFLFGAALISNPPYFSHILGAEVAPLKDPLESPVAQNVLSIDVDNIQSNQVQIRLLNGNTWLDLDKTDLGIELNDDKNTLAYISYYFGRQSKNIIYVGSPSACEDIADRIRQLIDQDSGTKIKTEDIPESIRSLASFIQDNIHPGYFLADMLERGVAFHFGKMPTLLRKGIEQEFSENPFLKYLVCTSTLLHGVNLPAKNMFMLKPSEGERWLGKNADPMQAPSFWNLAGRAGRLGKDFEGNVFVVNKSKWEKDPLEGDREQAVKSSLFDVLQNKQELILSLANAKVEALSKNPENEGVESAFVKLYTDYRKGSLQNTFLRSPIKIGEDFINSLSDAFSKLEFSVPDRILENNIAIPPLRQQRMLEYQLKKIENGQENGLIPLHPERPGAKANYIGLFSRYEKCFDGRENATKNAIRLAIIALDWMKGVPYPELIKNQQKINPKSSIPVIVRNTMETIEADIRFTLVQRTRCYIDLLIHAFEISGLSEKSSSIPALPLFLEVGASSSTMISLVGLGFSRTTAGKLNDKAVNHSMNRSESRQWLRKEKWESADLPKICLREVNDILASNLL